MSVTAKGKRSALPSLTEIAAAIRDGETTVDDLADAYGQSGPVLRRRLNNAGWDINGHPMRPWELRPSGVATCERCGRAREVKSGRAPSRICGDCKLVEPTWPFVGES